MGAAAAVISQDHTIALQLRKQLETEIDEFTVRLSVAEGLDWLAENRCDVMLISAELFGGDVAEAQDALATLCAASAATQVVLIAPAGSVRLAAAAVATSGLHYVRWPSADGELRAMVSRLVAAAATFRAGAESLTGDQGKMIGRSPAMQEVYRMLTVAAETDIPVLIRGETGTGKDLAAQSLHAQSGRAAEPFVPVHLGATPAELVASELFGAEKGAYTGANQQRPGKFEEAGKGTLFLDEIGTIDNKVQIALLRIIEQRRYTRLGGQDQLIANCRLVAATNADLAAEVAAQRFREDLYYRLDVLQIVLPPLRQRGDDVFLLAESFLHYFRSRFGKRIEGMSPAFRDKLQSYGWPGNVRELRNVMQRAILLSQSRELTVNDLPARIRGGEGSGERIGIAVGTPLAVVERELILKTIAATGGNKAAAARRLGISRRALYNRLAKYRRAGESGGRRGSQGHLVDDALDGGL